MGFTWAMQDHVCLVPWYPAAMTDSKASCVALVARAKPTCILDLGVNIPAGKMQAKLCRPFKDSRRREAQHTYGHFIIVIMLVSSCTGSCAVHALFLLELVPGHHVDSEAHRQGLLEAGVCQVLAHVGRVAAHVLQHGHEVWLRQQRPGLRVHVQLGHELRSKHVAWSATLRLGLGLLGFFEPGLQCCILGVKCEACRSMMT